MTDLVGPDSWASMSPEERRARTNGCGPQWLSLDLVPDKLLGVSVEEACIVHDIAYSESSTRGERRQADRDFFGNMITLVDEAGGRWHKPRVFLAWTYWGFVRLFGGLSTSARAKTPR